MPIPMAQLFRLYIQMFLSYGLYVCIILETAHHRTTFGIFATSLNILHLMKIATKYSIFLHQLYFFLMGRSRTLFGGIGIKFHLGIAKGRGKRRVWGEGQNEGYFCKISIIKQDTNFISPTFGQTIFYLSHCNWNAQNLYARISSDFKQFFLVRNNFVYLKGTNMAPK